MAKRSVKAANITVVPQSTSSVRTFLLEQMIAVANKRLDHPTALAICRLAQQAYNFSKLELRASDLAAKHGGQLKLKNWDFENVVDASVAVESDKTVKR